MYIVSPLTLSLEMYLHIRWPPPTERGNVLIVPFTSSIVRTSSSLSANRSRSDRCSGSLLTSVYISHHFYTD
ncbi:hypothetical protein LSAT2_018493 [Lamellibrachia satsuma]|nr:hypothetical protein LSAT2_018493 [Lamellibrachia satsuma]